MSEPEVIEDKNLLRDILTYDAEGYTILSNTMVDKGRWHVLMEVIFRRHSDNKLFIMYWNEAATEYQDSKYPEDAIECEMYTETVIKYRPMPRTSIGRDTVEKAKSPAAKH